MLIENRGICLYEYCFVVFWDKFFVCFIIWFMEILYKYILNILMLKDTSPIIEECISFFSSWIVNIETTKI